MQIQKNMAFGEIEDFRENSHSRNFLKITFNITVCAIALMVSGFNF